MNKITQQNIYILLKTTKRGKSRDSCSSCAPRSGFLRRQTWQSPGGNNQGSMFVLRMQVQNVASCYRTSSYSRSEELGRCYGLSPPITTGPSASTTRGQLLSPSIAVLSLSCSDKKVRESMCNHWSFTAPDIIKGWRRVKRLQRALTDILRANKATLLV